MLAVLCLCGYCSEINMKVRGHVVRSRFSFTDVLGLSLCVFSVRWLALILLKDCNF